MTYLDTSIAGNTFILIYMTDPARHHGNGMCGAMSNTRPTSDTEMGINISF